MTQVDIWESSIYRAAVTTLFKKNRVSFTMMLYSLSRKGSSIKFELYNTDISTYTLDAIKSWKGGRWRHARLRCSCWPCLCCMAHTYIYIYFSGNITSLVKHSQAVSASSSCSLFIWLRIRIRGWVPVGLRFFFCCFFFISRRLFRFLDDEQGAWVARWPRSLNLAASFRLSVVEGARREQARSARRAQGDLLGKGKRVPKALFNYQRTAPFRKSWCSVSGTLTAHPPAVADRNDDDDGVALFIPSLHCVLDPHNCCIGDNQRVLSDL